VSDAQPWSAEDVVRARALWDAGMIASEIARVLGRTKNAVSGLRKRHGWPIRAEPVGGRTALLKAQQRTAPKPPKPAPLRAVLPVPVPEPRPPEPPPAPVPEPVVRMPRPVPLPAVSAARSCQWPGRPWRRPWPYCGAEVVPGRPYCLAHCLRAYTGTTRRLEQAV